MKLTITSLLAALFFAPAAFACDSGCDKNKDGDKEKATITASCDKNAALADCGKCDKKKKKDADKDDDDATLLAA